MECNTDLYIKLTDASLKISGGFELPSIAVLRQAQPHLCASNSLPFSLLT